MLLTLPLELRRTIYRELLLDKDLPLQPQSYWVTRIRPRRKIQPTILRACKQVYSEGMEILYEENVFRYEILPFVYASEGRKRGDRLLDENFERINHVSSVQIPLQLFSNNPLSYHDLPEGCLCSLTDSPTHF